jgi:hypothetical protein
MLDNMKIHPVLVYEHSELQMERRADESKKEEAEVEAQPTQTCALTLTSHIVFDLAQTCTTIASLMFLRSVWQIRERFSHLCPGHHCTSSIQFCPCLSAQRPRSDVGHQS